MNSIELYEYSIELYENYFTYLIVKFKYFH
jgi:hypothetical protein